MTWSTQKKNTSGNQSWSFYYLLWSFWIQSPKEYCASYELSIRPLREKLLKFVSNLNYYAKNYHFPKKNYTHDVGDAIVMHVENCVFDSIHLRSTKIKWFARRLTCSLHLNYIPTLNSESTLFLLILLWFSTRLIQ